MTDAYNALLDWQANCNGLSFNQVLKCIVEAHKPYYSQEQLAYALGYHKTWLSHILAGTRLIRHKHVTNIAKAIPDLIYQSLSTDSSLRASVNEFPSKLSLVDEIEALAIQVIIETCEHLKNSQSKSLYHLSATRHLQQTLYVSFVCDFLSTNGLGES